MEIRRVVTISLVDSFALRETLDVFRQLQNSISDVCFNNGKPLHAVALQRAIYANVKGRLNSQMTLTAMRLVAGAYASTQTGYKRRLAMEIKRKVKFEARGWNYKPKTIRQPGICQFKKPMAMFLVGVRGRDASFRKDGILSIWTVEGRRRLSYEIVPAHRKLFEQAKEIDSVTVIERDGRLYGRVAITLEVPEPKSITPIGIDLNETNAVVAVDTDGRELFVTGLSTKVKNRITSHTVGKLQKKLAARKAEKRDTRSVRRALKRLGRKRSRRTKDFARCTAKKLVDWAPKDAVLIFEDLQMSQPMKGLTRGASLRRRLSLWSHSAIRQAVTNKAEIAGLGVVFVNPAYTSQNCSRCGLRGRRNRHKFSCLHCGHEVHADVNAATNIRDKFVQSRLDGAKSTAPEALPQGEGKPSASADAG